MEIALGRYAHPPPRLSSFDHTHSHRVKVKQSQCNVLHTELAGKILTSITASWLSTALQHPAMSVCREVLYWLR